MPPASSTAAATPREPGAAFAKLASSYNFRYQGARSEIFADLVIEECARTARPSRVLDIGCGKGIELNLDLTRKIAKACDELYGIEPDTGIVPPEGVFTTYEHALMETSKVEPGSVNVAYSFMVMEHVQDPGAYMKAVYKALRPGGSYMFMTINANHYFALLAGTARSIRIDEMALRAIRGKAEVESYHYPTAYKVNSPRSIGRVARELGFEEPTYAFMEQHGPTPYFRGPLKPVLWLMNAKRATIKSPGALLELVCRVRKPG
jgi:SAM-dependent methyltransferase